MLLTHKLTLFGVYAFVTAGTFALLIVFFFVIPSTEKHRGIEIARTQGKATSQDNPAQENSLSIDERFRERRSHARNVCLEKAGYYGNNTESLPNESPIFEYSFYDERFQVVFCTVPKVASTHWKLLFEAAVKGDVNLTDGKKDRFPGHAMRFMERLINTVRELRTEMLTKFVKIVFVRDPLDRLISTWRNRFLPPKTPVYEDIAKHIIDTFRDKMLKSNKTSGTLEVDDESKFVTLEEFFKFLVAEGSKPGRWDDPHWRSQVSHCEPCRVGYDIIGRFENLEDESAYIATDLFLQKDLKLQTSAQGSLAADLVAAKLPKHSLTFYYASTIPAQLVNQVIDMYAHDFDIFGYKMMKI